MCRKGESIFLRKDGRYEARYIKTYSNTGKAVYGYVYGKTYIECKKKRNEKLINLKEERNDKKIYINKSFNFLIDKWLEEKKKKIKISSYSRYLQLVNTHIKNDIGKVKINRLTTEIINEFLNKKIKAGRIDKKGGLSRNTVYDDDYYILTGNHKIMDPRTYYNHYKKILNKAGNLDYTYHDLRHTFATNCNELGIDIKTLMELLGHSNVSTTMNIYVHSSLENKRTFINQL